MRVVSTDKQESVVGCAFSSPSLMRYLPIQNLNPGRAEIRGRGYVVFFSQKTVIVCVCVVVQYSSDS